MRHDKLEQQLGLLLMLTQGRSYTVGQICEMFRLSPRNVYYYLDFFRETGFIVEKREGGYCIDRSSPFLRQLTDNIAFTEEEVIAMYRILNKVEEDAVVRNLKRKLARFYDLDILNDQQLVVQQAKAVNALAYAIRMRKMVVLRGYSSGHSQTQRDRLVEPFMLMNNNQDVRCYEPSSKQNKTLRNIVLDMEDEVLANAGVDVFEEVFKLIFIKLYDELEGARDKSRNLEFRNYGESDAELKVKIEKLFNKVKNKWEGVFGSDEKIKLSPSHLSICVSSLQEVKLFNSNLEVIDDAFEYLINKNAKGEKGQYFTPRYVIDMCVKMLNPNADETMIDTASGSCGFPIHTCFYVWKQIYKQKGIEASHLFTAEKKIPECEDYVKEKIFGIDFDDRSVRVSKMLNLIAGDGHTNVLYLNSIDYARWDEFTKDDEWENVYFDGFRRLKKLRATKDENRDFKFDILMANPPFAGDIKEPRILHTYELGKNASGKWQQKVGRDILFIERNLNMLKSGGRMAIVLPQGRFNNSSDKYIREFISEHARILAVVGLHGNVFKPHTGTKTSVLFVQKWDDKLCPKTDDYPIFFATMSKPSKDNSGDKIYYPLQDTHGHWVVEHDLFNPHLAGDEPIRQKNESDEEYQQRLADYQDNVQKYKEFDKDGIAEAFIDFAKEQGLSFWRE